MAQILAAQLRQPAKSQNGLSHDDPQRKGAEALPSIRHATEQRTRRELGQHGKNIGNAERGGRRGRARRGEGKTPAINRGV